MKKILREKSLGVLIPTLSKEWHPFKNGELTPYDVTSRSNRKVWWYLPYDDPKTGKHFDFEWKAIISDRARGVRCPFLTGNKVWCGYNDLASCNPNLAREWHPFKNGELTPYDVTSRSNKKVWWYLSYDDSKTGKHFDFEWEATIIQRCSGNGCPFLSGKSVWKGFNDLATNAPQLSKEWHPTRNGDLTPYDVTCRSSKKVWWYLPYDDPKTGKHFDFEWEAIIGNRYIWDKCPFLEGRKVWRGYNDLGSCNPSLAREWHPTRNGNLTPYDVFCNSTNVVWWYLPYDDPKTGKHFDFEWKARISDRKAGNGCPYIGGARVWRGYNDVPTKAPNLVKEWHPTKNGTLSPYDVAVYSEIRVWWYLPYDDPKTGKHFDFEWKARVCDRVQSPGCPFISGKRVWRGYNDLGTNNQELSKEWHPTKNGKLTPYDVTVNSGRKVWWQVSLYNDFGEKYEIEWRARVCSRIRGEGYERINIIKKSR